MTCSVCHIHSGLDHGLHDCLGRFHVAALRTHQENHRACCSHRQGNTASLDVPLCGGFYHNSLFLHQRQVQIILNFSTEPLQAIRCLEAASFNENHPFDGPGNKRKGGILQNAGRINRFLRMRGLITVGASANGLQEDAGDSDTSDIFTSTGIASTLDPEPRNISSFWQPQELKRAGVGLELDLRFMFLEQLMGRARELDVAGVEETMSEMAAVGLKPGPRSYHGLIASYSRAGNVKGALHALKREVNSGCIPLPETFTALVRSFASIGEHEVGEQLLGTMERYKLDARKTWLILIDELLSNGYLSEATSTFLKGAKGGYRATDELFDALVEANAKVNDHASCIHILRQMEYYGRKCETFHYNCLLMVEANLGESDIAWFRFDDMLYEDDRKKPDTESYNWLLLSQIRSTVGGGRLPQIIDALGMMVEDHKRVLPNERTYVILVEGFTKYNVPDEATRHFRALSRLYQGGMKQLHNDGKHGDPLSLYSRLLCLHGRIDDLYEALEVMEREKQMLPKRAMIVNRKGRTMVSSWLEPLQQEADLGYDIDYVARYIAEGGLTGTRQRWSPSFDGTISPVNPDNEGFRFAAPMEVSFKKYCAEQRAQYTMDLIKKLKREGVRALGWGATQEDVSRILEKLHKDMLAESIEPVRKPKAASKMLVPELKEELDAQGLPSDGTRAILYQRVQKSRRINQARGRPLWLPPVVEQLNEVDARLEKFMSKLNLKNENNTEYWKKRFLGENVQEEEEESEENEELQNVVGGLEGVFPEKEEDTDGEEDIDDEVDDPEDAGEEVEEVQPPAMLATQLMDEEAALEMQRRDEYYFEFNLEEQLAELKRYRIFGVDDMYTIVDVWGWTWEIDIDAYKPEKWSKEREVKLGMKLLKKVVDLGGVPTIGDCAMLLRAAIRTPWPEAMVNILQQTHKLGYAFGIRIYDEVVTLCMNLDERDAAIAIVTDMEDTGIKIPNEILDKIIPEETTLE